MADLKTQVQTSANQLKQIWTLTSGVTGTELPTNCFERWLGRASLHWPLSRTAHLFLCREKAWEVVQAVASPDETRDGSSNLVTYGLQKMDFSVARHLALTSYSAVTWSIYDRLANVCGRLAGVANLSENPRQNPKACEDFLGRKDTLGFGAHLHLKQAYAWPLKVTYKVRNWLVHEGYEEGSTRMFKGDKIEDGFTLHDDAAVHLEQCCDYKADNGKIDTSCLSASKECWPTRDLLKILKTYHAELDTLFTGLVKWTVDSFVGQVVAFSERDKTTLSAIAARRST